mmetsp:Transcript_60622/g.132786  ORF Transcript_60622/g.132786 Transcript_60622/m.132786 type:complete len:238 (-) Transcript_60622:154-867(-)
MRSRTRRLGAATKRSRRPAVIVQRVRRRFGGVDLAASAGFLLLFGVVGPPVPSAALLRLRSPSAQAKKSHCSSRARGHTKKWRPLLAPSFFTSTSRQTSWCLHMGGSRRGDPAAIGSGPPGSVSASSSSWVAGIFSSSELIMATSSPPEGSALLTAGAGAGPSSSLPESTSKIKVSGVFQSSIPLSGGVEAFSRSNSSTHAVRCASSWSSSARRVRTSQNSADWQERQSAPAQVAHF